VPRCSLRCNISPPQVSPPILSSSTFTIDRLVTPLGVGALYCKARSHVKKQGCRNPPAPHRFPARATPTKPTTNASHIHSHTIRSRILHSGTALSTLLFPPTVAPIVYPHRRRIFTSASRCPHVSAQRAKSASLSAARVSRRFFSTTVSAQHHSQQ